MDDKIVRSPFPDKIVRSPFPEVCIPDHLSITDFLFRHFESFDDKNALIDGLTDRTFSFTELVQASKRVAGAWHRQGLRQGDMLLIICPSMVEYPIAIFAALSLGMTVTTCNPLSMQDGIIEQMRDSGATYVLTVPIITEKVLGTANTYKEIKGIYTVGSAPGCLPFSPLITEDGPAPPRPDIDVRNDVALLIYSSGTTGKPKGVQLTHYNVVSLLCQVLCPASKVVCESDIALSVLPFFHIYGCVFILMMALRSGAAVFILPRFQLPTYLKAIQRYKATVLFVVPPIAILVAKHHIVTKFDLTSVRKIFCAAAPLARDIQQELMDRIQLPEMTQGYGLTETCTAVTLSATGCATTGSAGVALPNSTLKVVDLENGSSLGPYRDGEIWVKGPQVMKGYHNRPEQTRDTIDSQGWLHTGDIGYYTSVGEIFIINRLKELIKYKAYQVAPASLESLLLTHPAISDAAVIGIPDTLAGELPRAYVVLKQGQNVTQAVIQNFVKEKVAPHMQLRGGVRFLKDIPKSDSGKILRRELKQQALSSKL